MSSSWLRSAVLGLQSKVKRLETAEEVHIITASAVGSTNTLDEHTEVVLINGLTPFNLISAIRMRGKFVYFKNTGGTNVTLDAYDTETIDGSGTLVLAAGDSATLFSDGTNWLVF